MNYDIKLYVHGVPHGQKTWGISEFDKSYIESFYGRKTDVQVQMLVELKQFATNTYCYYTYYRNGNISDNSGRTGGYFALTIRLNCCYIDIQNIYNLLDAAYHKFIIGNVLTNANGNTKFLCTDFAQTEKNLVALEQEIKHYLMQFSTDSDFISLHGFKVNGVADIAKLNLAESESNTIVVHLKTHSNISISPAYPTTKEQKFIKEMNHKISEIKNNAQKEIDCIKEEYNKNIQNIRQEKEKEIKIIKEEHKDVDITIRSLREENALRNKEINQYKIEISNVKKDIDTLKAYKSAYEKLKFEHEETKRNVEKLQKSLSSLKDLSNTLNLHDPSKTEKDSKKETFFIKIIEKLHPFVDLFTMVILLILIGTLVFSYDVHNNRLEDKISMVKEEIRILNQNLSEKDTKSANKQESESNIQDREGYPLDMDGKNTTTNMDIYSNARIDIEGISRKKPMRKDSTYTVKLIGIENIEDKGEWKSEDFYIHGNRITPKHEGICKITFVSNILGLNKTRTIDVKE